MWATIVAVVGIGLYVLDPLNRFSSSTTISPLQSSTIAFQPIKRSALPQLNPFLLAFDDNDSHGEAAGCPAHAYTTHILSRAPLVIYIEGFLSEEDRAVLLRLSEPRWTPSTTTSDGGGTLEHNSSVRNSSVALLPRRVATASSERTGANETEDVGNDEAADVLVMRCLEQRARSFQGWREQVFLERLRTQKYELRGHYAGHFDWSSNAGGWGRVSSFMAWVAGDGDAPTEKPEFVEGGGTEFPLLRVRADVMGEWGRKWCRFVNCPELDVSESELGGETREVKEKVGIVFKPKPGNAVYWENFRPDGTGMGWNETWHAGLPVTKGVKVGLNIWSWGWID